MKKLLLIIVFIPLNIYSIILSGIYLPYKDNMYGVGINYNHNNIYYGIDFLFGGKTNIVNSKKQTLGVDYHWNSHSINLNTGLQVGNMNLGCNFGYLFEDKVFFNTPEYYKIYNYIYGLDVGVKIKKSYFSIGYNNLNIVKLKIGFII